MLTREGVAAWARDRHGLGDAEEQLVEAPLVFTISLAPPGHQGGAIAVVSRQTGEFWLLNPASDFHALRGARTDQELRQAIGHADPEGTVVPVATRAAVRSWLAERSTWTHLDDRVTDLGWAFLVNTQPDEHLDGTGPQDRTAGPIVVSKAGGAIWWLPWSPDLVPALGAANFEEFRAATARAGHLLPDPPQDWLPDLVEQPRGQREVTKAGLIAWLASERGWRHVEDRITDLGWAFSVNTQPDAYLDGDESAMTYGNGPLIVVKRTGAAWALSSRPEQTALAGARDEHEFTRQLLLAMPAANRDWPSGGWVPLPAAEPPSGAHDAPVGEEQLVGWLRNTRGWRTFDGRVGDNDWAYVVSTQPDAYHDGDRSAMTYGNGPMVVVKRTGAVWVLSSSPAEFSAATAATEDDFHAAVAAAVPNAAPTEWVPR